jgi:hypothetical protein
MFNVKTIRSIKARMPTDKTEEALCSFAQEGLTPTESPGGFQPHKKERL